MNIALLYAKKQLIEEFLEKFNTDRAHDGAEINAVLVPNDLLLGI